MHSNITLLDAQIMASPAVELGTHIRMSRKQKGLTIAQLASQIGRPREWLNRIELEDRYSFVYGFLTRTDQDRDAFLTAESQLSRSFLLVKHLDDCRKNADEIIFGGN